MDKDILRKQLTASQDESYELEISPFVNSKVKTISDIFRLLGDNDFIIFSKSHPLTLHMFNEVSGKYVRTLKFIPESGKLEFINESVSSSNVIKLIATEPFGNPLKEYTIEIYSDGSIKVSENLAYAIIDGILLIYDKTSKEHKLYSKYLKTPKIMELYKLIKNFDKEDDDNLEEKLTSLISFINENLFQLVEGCRISYILESSITKSNKVAKDTGVLNLKKIKRIDLKSFLKDTITIYYVSDKYPIEMETSYVYLKLFPKNNDEIVFTHDDGQLIKLVTEKGSEVTIKGGKITFSKEYILEVLKELRRKKSINSDIFMKLIDKLFDSIQRGITIDEFIDEYFDEIQEMLIQYSSITIYSVESVDEDIKE